MRRTLVIDDKLLEEARRTPCTSGVRETIEARLREDRSNQRSKELNTMKEDAPLCQHRIFASFF